MKAHDDITQAAHNSLKSLYKLHFLYINYSTILESHTTKLHQITMPQDILNNILHVHQH